MTITHIADPAEVNARYGDAHEPGNRLPWQSGKLGVTVFVSDQGGCVFLIVRHDPMQPPSRLVRAFFRDAPEAAAAVVECSGEAERTALLAPIQSTIAASLEAEEEDKPSRPANVIDLDAPAPSFKQETRLGEILKERFDALRDEAAKAASQPIYKTPLNPENAWRSHSLQSFFLADAAQFNKWFPVIQAPSNILPNRSTDRSTFVFTAFDDLAYFTMLVREDLEQSSRNRFVREAFNAVPNAYAWVVRFDDWLMRDTFALGLQCRLFGSLLDHSEFDDLPVYGDDPSDGMGPRGDGDAGIPAVTIRPKPTRSGSDAKELPEDDEPTIFTIGPTELAETPTEGELVPARVTYKA